MINEQPWGSWFKKTSTASSVPIAGTRAPILPTRVAGNPAIIGVVGPSSGTQQQSAEDFIREQANRYIQAQLDTIAAQKQAYLDDLQQKSDLEMKRGQALAQALTSLNVPGQIQNIYGNASADIGGLAQAFSGSLRDTATANAAQQSRMLSGSGQEGTVANNGEAMGDVLYGAQGYVPAKSLGEAGAAFAADAALQPGYAQRIGQVKAGDVYSAGLEGLKQFTDAILDANASRPQIEHDLMTDYQAQQKANQPNLTSKTLANGQIQFFNEDTGEAVGAPQGPKRATKSAGGVNLQARTLANGQVQWFNPKTGKAVGKAVGPPRPEKDTTTKLQARSLANGQIQWFDPTTGQPVGGAQGPVRKTTKKAAGGGSYNLQLKKLPNGSQQWFDPRTGKAVGTPIAPPSGKSKYTAAALAKFASTAGKIASKAWNGVKVTQEIDGEKVTGTQHMTYQEAMREGLAQGVPLNIMQQSLNKYWTKPGFDRDFINGKWTKNIHGTGRPSKTFQERNPQANAQNASVNLPKVGHAETLPVSWEPTHVTDGLGWGTRTAVDLHVGAKAGTPVGAPVSGTVLYYHPDGAIGGGSMEIMGDDGYLYFIAHVDDGVAANTRVERGSQIATISSRESPHHVHIDRRFVGSRS